MKKFIRVLMWTIIVTVFLGTFVFLYLNSQPQKHVFEIITPTIGDIKRTTVMTGKIQPRDEIEIKPQISGIIDEINVNPGDHVRNGDIIAKIRVIPDENQLSSAQNRVDVAQLSLDQVYREFERTKTLFEKKYVSREEFEQAENNYDKAKTELASALDALSIIRDGISSTNAQQSNTFVRATIDGLILEVPVKVGSSVIQTNTMNDGTTIATIADMNNLIFVGKIDETEVGLMKNGMPMQLSIGALPDVSLSALIEYISPKGVDDNGSNTFEVKAAIEMSDSVYLRAGYSANGTAILNNENSVLTIPERVVEFSGDSTFVYCLTDSVTEQIFTRRSINTGISDGVNIQVISGIDAHDKLRGFELK